MKSKVSPIAFLVVALGCGGSANTGGGETGAAGADTSSAASSGVLSGGFGGAVAKGGGGGVSTGGTGTAGNGGAEAGASSAAGGASGGVGTAGAAGTTCGQLTALDACFAAFCKASGAGTPFCTCFAKGYDLAPAPDCACIPLNSAAFCQQAEANGLDGSHLDCTAATTAVASQCAQWRRHTPGRVAKRIRWP